MKNSGGSGPSGSEDSDDDTSTARTIVADNGTNVLDVGGFGLASPPAVLRPQNWDVMASGVHFGTRGTNLKLVEILCSLLAAFGSLFVITWRIGIVYSKKRKQKNLVSVHLYN